MMPRVLVWFSCGAASAVAAREAIDKYGHRGVHVVYCDTLASEHPDNWRFLHDVQTWLDHPVERIGSKKYDTIDEVFERTRYMAGISGARCTTEMKKIPRLDYQRDDDIHVFGLTADEGSRIENFVGNNLELTLDWVLAARNITKEGCYRIIREAGIALPVMYSLGFKNNNCIGCVKATSVVYWRRVREHFPEVFEKRARQSRLLGVRLVRYRGERIFLDQLPLLVEDSRAEEDIECGPVCVTPRVAESELREMAKLLGVQDV